MVVGKGGREDRERSELARIACKLAYCGISSRREMIADVVTGNLRALRSVRDLIEP
jgi:hypothetical protein